MIVNVKDYTGFDLWLDRDTLQVNTANGIQYERNTRTVEKLSEVLYEPEALPMDTELYHVYYVTSLPDDVAALLGRYDLTYSPVLLPPLTVGQEFVKTAGHYHPMVPGTRYSYPEVYTQLYGTLHLLLQKRDPVKPTTPLDCTLIEMTPGTSVMIPPEYAHILINTSNDVALMAGLYNTDFRPDYTDIQAQRGLAYYLLQGDDGQPNVVGNPHYSDAPGLRRPDDLAGTIFEPPDATQPLWTSFEKNPDTYAFLTQPDEMESYFSRFD